MNKNRLIYGIIISMLSGCGTTLNVEYPVFPNTKEGRALQKFIGNKKVVGVIIEKPQKEQWSQVLGETSMIDQMPGKIFEAMDKAGYYKLIDVSKTSDRMNEIAYSLSGMTQNRLELGKELAAQLLLFVGYQKPVFFCGTENKLSASKAMFAAAVTIYNANNKKNRQLNVNTDVMVPTGYVDLTIPLEATLVVTETGQIRKSVVSEPYRLFNSAGNTSCPSPLKAYDEALKIAAEKVMSRLSPKVKTAEIKIATSDDDPDVADLLNEGYLEMSGDTPNMQRAFENWQKADRKAKGKSAGALSNLGAYYFSIGDFENAIKYFEKAMELKTGSRNYYRELRKKVEAAQTSASEFYNEN